MTCDLYLGRKNPWFDLFDVHRKKFHGGAWRYIAENLDYPFYLVRDRLKGADNGTLEEVRPGEGKILAVDGKKVAVYRDPNGKLLFRSPICTHMGCIIRWIIRTKHGIARVTAPDFIRTAPFTPGRTKRRLVKIQPQGNDEAASLVQPNSAASAPSLTPVLVLPSVSIGVRTITTDLPD